MKKPEIPTDERRRLDILRSLNILDTPPEERFDRLTRLAKHLFNVPVAQVSLIDETRQWLKSCIGMDPVEIPRELTFCGHTILEEGTLVVTDTTKDERFADNPLVLIKPKVRFYAGHPITINGSRVGTLCVGDYVSREFTKDEELLLEDLAYMAQQELSAVHLASMDELTDLTNRRGFYVLANKALKLCAQNGIPVTLMYFDLNDFKSVNDKHGHAEGDKILIAFANHMKESLRDTDLIARIGGDEFIALMTGLEDKEAEVIQQRLKDAILRHNKDIAEGCEILYSVGTLKFQPEVDQPIDSFLAEADSLMYKQKKERRTKDF